MEKQIANMVRGVIMGELGLDREWIRKEAIKVVTETVEKRLNRMIEQGEFKKILRQVMEEMYNTRPPMAYMSFKATIEKAIYDVARDFVNANVELKIVDPPGGAK